MRLTTQYRYYLLSIYYIVYDIFIYLYKQQNAEIFREKCKKFHVDKVKIYGIIVEINLFPNNISCLSVF